MKLKQLLQELNETEIYKNFLKENPEAFFAVGFFILDLEKETETFQLDFFIQEKKQITSFEFPIKEEKTHEDKIENLEEQSSEIKIDIDDLKTEVKKRIAENNSSLLPTKIIATISKNQWNLTCMDDSLGILQLKINSKTGEQDSFKKGSLMEFMGIPKKK
jgi:predicted transcriptional regulator